MLPFSALFKTLMTAFCSPRWMYHGRFEKNPKSRTWRYNIRILALVSDFACSSKSVSQSWLTEMPILRFYDIRWLDGLLRVSLYFSFHTCLTHITVVIQSIRRVISRQYRLISHSMLVKITKMIILPMNSYYQVDTGTRTKTTYTNQYLNFFHLKIRDKK